MKERVIHERVPFLRNEKRTILIIEHFIKSPISEWEENCTFGKYLLIAIIKYLANTHYLIYYINKAFVWIHTLHEKIHV